jgi:hypothetical protein
MGSSNGRGATPGRAAPRFKSAVSTAIANDYIGQGASSVDGELIEPRERARRIETIRRGLLCGYDIVRRNGTTAQRGAILSAFAALRGVAQ